MLQEVFIHLTVLTLQVDQNDKWRLFFKKEGAKTVWGTWVQQLISFFFCITCSWWPLTSYYVFCTFLRNSLWLDLSCWQSKQASSPLSLLLMTSYLFSSFHTCSLLFTPLLTNDSFTLWLKLNDKPTKKTYLKCDSYPRVPLIPKMKILRVNMQRLFLIKEMQWLDS